MNFSGIGNSSKTGNLGNFSEFSKIIKEDILKSKIRLLKKRKKRIIITVSAVIFQSIFLATYIVFMISMISNMVDTKPQKSFSASQEELAITTTVTEESTNKSTTAIVTTTTTTITAKTTEITTTITTTTEPTDSTDTVETANSVELEAGPEQENPIDEIEAPAWYGEVLNAGNGLIQGPSGTETYYNLPMSGVVALMREMGFDEVNYPYWEREDGVKMFGPYVMCAANLEIRPKGTIIQSSLGMAIVCDTGGFVEWDPERLDIAVNW